MEKKLAKSLLSANAHQRRRLYRQVYDEFFRKVPFPNESEKDRIGSGFVSGHVKLLNHFLKPDSTFLEIGPGDCSLSLAVTKSVRKVYAVDVSPKPSRSLHKPKNFHLIVADGVSVPVPKASVNIAFSSQVLEHIHPDDALSHLKNVHRALTETGLYIAITPNRLWGPHDVSQFFEDKAEGLHLKEYTVTELEKLFKTAGFSTVQLFIEVRGKVIRYPTFPVKVVEWCIQLLPPSVQKRVAKFAPFTLLLGILVIAEKGTT